MTKQLAMGFAVSIIMAAAISTARASISLSDDFQSYTSSSSAVASGAVWDGSVPSGSKTEYSSYVPAGKALFVQGTGTRAVATIAVDTSQRGSIAFNLPLGSASPQYNGSFDTQADIEQVGLEGSSSANPNTFAASGSADINQNRWSLFEMTIAPSHAAATAATRFQLAQSSQSWYFFDTETVDDLQPTNAAQVPEPASLAIWSVIALGVGVAYRRRTGRKTGGKSRATTRRPGV